MITRDEAERIAAEVTGASANNADKGWELEEFGAGWLMIEYANRGHRGGAARVIERESGRVMRFPSFVSPDRIVEEYDEVLEYGRPEDL